MEVLGLSIDIDPSSQQGRVVCNRCESGWSSRKPEGGRTTWMCPKGCNADG